MQSDRLVLEATPSRSDTLHRLHPKQGSGELGPALTSSKCPMLLYVTRVHTSSHIASTRTVLVFLPKRVSSIVHPERRAPEPTPAGPESRAAMGISTPLPGGEGVEMPIFHGSDSGTPVLPRLHARKSRR